MYRMVKTATLILGVCAVLALAVPVQAQVVVVQSAPIVAPAPVIAYQPSYVVPSISYSIPTYTVPRVSYYAPLAVTTYSTPVTPVVSYSVPVSTVVSPGVYTTYTYRNGLGIFRPRYVSQSYYTPILP